MVETTEKPAQKMIYSLQEADPKNVKELGGKGASQPATRALGLRVPECFTIITTMAVQFYKNGGKWTEGLWEETITRLAYLEEITGRQFGSLSGTPLTLSVRSGAEISMAGMMDSILNVGLNDQTVQALAKATNARFAYDCYRRLILMFSSSRYNIPKEKFENLLKAMKAEEGVTKDSEISIQGQKQLVEQSKQIVRDAGHEFPQDIHEQLRESITAVFLSWNNERAIEYRKYYGISNDLGTAVTVQAMVFGNLDEKSGTSVLMTRNTITGENMPEADSIINAQGEDAVNGSSLTLKLCKESKLPGLSLEELMPEQFEEILQIAQIIEDDAKDMMDIEITIENGVVFVLQTRVAKRSGAAAFKVALDMINEQLIDRDTAVLRIKAEDIFKILHKELAPTKEQEPATKGIAASPGAGVGQVVFTSEKAEQLRAEDKNVRLILVRDKTCPDDIKGMKASNGILTATGGPSSHAAVVGKQMGVPVVVSCSSITINEEGGCFTYGGRVINEMEWVSINGSTGDVYFEEVATKDPVITDEFKTFMGWCQQDATDAGMHVRVNAEEADQFTLARSFGATGAGLVRKEHMMYIDETLPVFQELILNINDEKQRPLLLKKLLPHVKESFKKIFIAMDGQPTTFRELDPPLAEFLQSEKDIEKQDLPQEEINRQKIMRHSLEESNDLGGLRGVRLLLKFPDLAEMLIRAKFEAACEAIADGIDVRLEVMIPMVSVIEEFDQMSEIIERTAAAVMQEQGISMEYSIGVMIETPAAVIIAGELASHPRCKFLSFGTNDLTQFTLGVSRNDVGGWLPVYLERGIWKKNPFVTLHKTVAKSIFAAVKDAREANPNIKIGVCGEHGGDPESIKVFYAAGFNYVSCSAPTVPVAFLGIAQAATLERQRLALAVTTTQVEEMVEG